MVPPESPHRSPRMANMFEEKTMNGSVVTPKTAGTESTANTMSLSSMQVKTSRSGVAFFTKEPPSSWTYHGDEGA